MITKLLTICLGPVVAAEKQLRRRKLVIAVLLAGALGLGGFVALSILVAWWSWAAVFGLLGTLVLVALVGLAQIERTAPDFRALARRIEEKHPDLRSALLAAMDQRPGPDGELSYLQKRLLGEISEHAIRNRWVRKVSERRLAAAGWGQFAAILAFGAALWLFLGEAPYRAGSKGAVAEETAEASETPAQVEVRVTPGDVELEKGARLVVEATFAGRAPAAALLVHRGEGGEARLPMQIGLDDSVFSALIPKVETDGSYHIVYEAERTPDFSIATFEYPELSRADALVTPPAYLGGEKEEIADTRKITVMEGAGVEWRLRVNKPLAAAELFSEEGEILTLTPDPADPTLLVASHVPEKTRRYRVHLIDGEDRANRRPPWLSVTVKENLPPKLKLTYPGRDFEVSALQEMPLEAEVWDDVEVLRTGVAFQFRGKETEIVLEEAALPGGKNHALSTTLDFEALGAKERDLVSYHFWAEDRDKAGEVRRSASDQFFAEVRLFEEILREGAPGGGEGGSPPGGGQADELIQIQKDIVNAAWKLIRDDRGGKAFESLVEDVGVARESQDIVVGKATQALEEIEDAELREMFLKAREEMVQASATFAEAAEKLDGEILVAAHGSATAAYAELLKARARETEISTSRSQSANASQTQQRQQQMMNLELEQKELKYEEQSMAQDPAQTAEQQENLAVLNRLKDLARRQEAIAEKIKELENRLQNASEEEKAEIERQLKRLQEEQRELLRELDDLAERMDSEENRAEMSEQREELAETRESVQETAENLESGDLADAANAATRASEKLEELKEEFREKTSRQFANEMKSLRDASRELVESQEALGEQVEGIADAPTDDPFSADKQQERGELAQALSDQARKVGEVLDQMRNLSEQAEAGEPLLSDALYEAVREAMTGGIEESLDDAARDVAFNRATVARSAEEAAARGIEQLAESIENAAEKILGNEADALRLARSELDKLIEAAKDEADRLAENEGAEEGQAQDPRGAGTAAEAEAEGGAGGLAEAKEKGKGKGKSPGEPGEGASEQASKEKGKGKGETPGEGEGEGQPGELAETGAQPGAGQQPGEGEGEGQPGELAETGAQPGDGQQPGEGEQASEGKAKGKGKGEAEGEGEGEGNSSESLAESGKAKGTGEGEGEGEGASSAEGQAQTGKGKGKGEGPRRVPLPGNGQGEAPSEGPRQLASGRGSSGGGGAMNNGGDDRNEGLPTGGPLAGPLFFDEASEERRPGPITGEDYEKWADRLGNIEEMLPQEDLRNEVARVRDEARAMRIDYRRDDLPPGAATINQKITEPLVELRQRLSEEIAKLNRENPVSPIDRDPVPSEFRDLVRRYYEELGAGE